MDQRSCFSRTWKILNDQQKRKVLDIIADINTENGIFFSKDEFYSTLKGTAVGDDEYNNFKILHILLKMSDLSDLNDLYNAQDVILLCEILENRFQAMYNKTLYNPRKCNSVRKLGSCIQCEQSKITSN